MAADLENVEAGLGGLIENDPAEVAEPMADLFAAGGKRIRPALVLLAAKCGRYDLAKLTPAAIAVELTHTATLVHDDVIDRAQLRRGRPTVAAQLGDEPAIVVGDFYFAKAYEQAALTNSPQVVAILARAVMDICAGEVRQQSIRHRYTTGIEEYMRRIEAKTATLLAACCDIGGLLGGVDGAGRSALRAYGRFLGLAFQIADDVLDYESSEDEIGKPIGHDIAEGFATLPLMLAMEDPQIAEKLGRILRAPSPRGSLRDPGRTSPPSREEGGVLSEADAQRVVELVRASRGPERALERARELSSEARRELESLGSGEARDTLAALTNYVVSRKL